MREIRMQAKQKVTTPDLLCLALVAFFQPSDCKKYMTPDQPF
jgi:hypothetical protein